MFDLFSVKTFDSIHLNFDPKELEVNLCDELRDHLLSSEPVVLRGRAKALKIFQLKKDLKFPKFIGSSKVFKIEELIRILIDFQKGLILKEKTLLGFVEKDDVLKAVFYEDERFFLEDQIDYLSEGSLMLCHQN
jgi:hypothetical protein